MSRLNRRTNTERTTTIEHDKPQFQSHLSTPRHPAIALYAKHLESRKKVPDHLANYVEVKPFESHFAPSEFKRWEHDYVYKQVDALTELMKRWRTEKSDQILVDICDYNEEKEEDDVNSWIRVFSDKFIQRGWFGGKGDEKDLGDSYDAENKALKLGKTLIRLSQWYKKHDNGKVIKFSEPFPDIMDITGTNVMQSQFDIDDELGIMAMNFETAVRKYYSVSCAKKILEDCSELPRGWPRKKTKRRKTKR